MTKQKHLDFLKYNYDVNLMMIVKGAHKGNQELKDEEKYIYNRRFMKELGYKTDSAVFEFVMSRFEKILFVMTSSMNFYMQTGMKKIMKNF